jgi:hypothetical protein
MDISSSSRLTLYHDGQFWVGLCEINDESGYSVCRIVFGAEPSDEEVLRFVCGRWTKLRFSKPDADIVAPKQPASNPKRRQREAAKELSSTVASTKAQAALSAQREEAKSQGRALSKERREAEAERRFELRQEKRKQRKRGH